MVDMFNQAQLDPVPITITGGDAVGRDSSRYRVPKRDLVSVLQVPSRVGAAQASSRHAAGARARSGAAGLSREDLSGRARQHREGAHDALALRFG